MRSGKTLAAAEAWFAERSIPLYGVNANPAQARWSRSPKAYGHVYIDDAACGCPLAHGQNGRPVVHWIGVANWLFDRDLSDSGWALFPEHELGGPEGETV